MTRTLTIPLATPPHDMAREEIQKQVAFLSRDIRNVRFCDGGTALQFDAPGDAGAELTKQARGLCDRVQRSLRSLQRKVVYQSPRLAAPVFRGDGSFPGVHRLGTGQVALEGLPLALFRYFDRRFEAIGNPWKARPVLTPTLVPSHVLSRCDYFRSFPHNVTFACHLPEDAGVVEDFRARHHDRQDLDEKAIHQMETPEACLSPAVCYHVYHMNEGRQLPQAGAAYGVCGKCFRYESSNLNDLRRLWDFTMREVVLLGGRDEVLAGRERGIELVVQFLEEHDLIGEIRTASDPFFVAPDALAKTYFQLTSETKYEISLPLPDGERLAVGSLNYHTDFFGRAFHIGVEGGGPAHSVCIAFGLERWVHAFLCQHGTDTTHWPEVVRRAPELAREV